MSGLFLLAIIGVWVTCCVALARSLARSVNSPTLRQLLGVALFLALLIAPIADEIVGGFQFRALCAKNAVLRVGVQNAEGRVTRYSSEPTNKLVPGTAIPIYDSGVKYTDEKTGELVASFHRYSAKGGLLIRTLGISEGSAPITLGRASCSPEDARGEVVSRTLKFTVVN